jgi:hypothetical protein
MRIIPFPGHRAGRSRQQEPDELEAALLGALAGAQAEHWVQLRADVRALAPPMSPAFEQRLRERVETLAAERPARPTPRSVAAPAAKRGTGRWRPRGARAAVTAVAGACAMVIAIAIVAGTLEHRGGAQHSPAQAVAGSSSGKATAGTNAPAAPFLKATEKPAVTALPLPSVAGPAGAAQAPGRVQQLAASITLAATPADVQSLADRVSRLTVGSGGFVQSSQVQQQSEGTSEASMQLSIPSGRLARFLAALAQLAPVRAESQSLQDITSSYADAQRALSDAVATRGALLRALARATTEGQIASLREQLNIAGGAIARARTALAAVSGRAANAITEVSIRGEASAAGEESTLGRGLDEAGHVLAVALTVLLVALAVLAPLTLLLLALAGGARVWRRQLRERALERS